MKVKTKMDKKLRRKYHRRYFEVSGSLYFPDGWEDSEFDLYGTMLFGRKKDAVKAAKKEFLVGKVTLFDNKVAELPRPQIRKVPGREVKFWDTKVY